MPGDQHNLNSGDTQGLLADPGSTSSNTPNTSTNDVAQQRSDSDEFSTSNPEFQNLLSSRSLNRPESSGPGPRMSIDSRMSKPRMSENAQRMSDLKAEMEASKKQIQQLTEAHQAVRDAVSGITATQELLQVAPPSRAKPAEANTNTDCGVGVDRNASKRSTNSKWSQARKDTDRPEEPFRQAPNASFQGPVEDEYYAANPWYGKPKDRPVFGIGKPLPHTVRNKVSKKSKAQEDTTSKRGPAARDPEKGEGTGGASVDGSNEKPKKPVFGLGSNLPHEGHKPVAEQQNNKFSLGKTLPHHEGGRPRGDLVQSQEDPGHGQPVSAPAKKQKNVTIDEALGGDSHEENLPYENQAAANPTHTEGRAPLDGDGRPQKDYDPFRTSFDDMSRNLSGGLSKNQNGDVDLTNWAVDSEPLGQREQDEAETGEKHPDELRNWWARIRARHPEPLAEFLCTLISVFLGVCATLQVNLGQNEYGNYETSCWAWGFAFMFGIYIGGGVSGSHMNPAISMCLWLFRGFPKKQMGIYFVAQMLASITAGALAFAIFHDTLHYYDPGLTSSTSTNFYSKPQTFVSPATAFFTQFVAAAVMMIVILATGDDQNNPPGAGLHAFIMGLATVMQKMTLGYNTGVALNPASDFGPRLVTLMVGYQTPMFTHDHCWWIWGPWVATAVGSIAGCSVYDLLVFVGSESPVNYRVPEKYRQRMSNIMPKMKD